jgi:hypothetical protein
MLSQSAGRQHLGSMLLIKQGTACSSTTSDEHNMSATAAVAKETSDELVAQVDSRALHFVTMHHTALSSRYSSS